MKFSSVLLFKSTNEEQIEPTAARGMRAVIQKRRRAGGPQSHCVRRGFVTGQPSEKTSTSAPFDHSPQHFGETGHIYPVKTTGRSYKYASCHPTLLARMRVGLGQGPG